MPIFAAKPFAPNLLKDMVFAGPHPCYREMDLSKFESLSRQGIRVILSLEDKSSDLISQVWQTDDDEYQHITGDSKQKFFIEDFTAPSVEKIDAIVDMVSKLIEDEKPVYVHCRGGLGRTGTILAAILVKLEQFEPQKAIDFVRNEYSRYAIETKEQEKCIRDYADHITSQNSDAIDDEHPKDYSGMRTRK